ncbi:ATP-binding protein [Shouchella shacheensis]|uniref:ATP-binding protein n=1 Tax=Shouchella shacheensis TaxID=1649580 RepID=UPI00073FC289|nr:sensor histidine kinase [Shouchella shacheensis]
MKISIQTKIIALVAGLISFVTLLLATIFAYLESQDIYDNLGNLALSTAVHIAGSPTIVNAFQSEDPTSILQPYAERVRKDTGAEFVVIGDAEGVRYAHPDTWKIGESMVGGDNDQALVEGEAYISEAKGSRGESLRGKTAIRDEEGNIIGIVSVGFLIQDIRSEIMQRFFMLASMTAGVIGLGIVGSILLSKSIRKDMYGLEPHEIASLFQLRQSTLKAIREGIIAVDAKGKVTMLNDSAREMLGIDDFREGTPIKEIVTDTLVPRVLKHGQPEYDQEFQMRGRIYIVNRQPILQQNEIVGVVCSFRDKTDLIEMANTLSDIKKYSDDLRSQNHEYTNKLYAISGYLYMNRIKEAMALISEETNRQKDEDVALTKNIKDMTVQAILMGKFGKASELKVHFQIDPGSQLDVLPNHMGQTQLISILGNVLDNALEASSYTPHPSVTFFVTDLGDDIVFEVSDNGPGLPADLSTLKQKGFTTKSGKGKRGYGLAIIDELLTPLEGMMECHSLSDGGALFVIYLPKSLDSK